jgi:uncharacterized RDD family membrane protein YckC
MRVVRETRDQLVFQKLPWGAAVAALVTVAAGTFMLMTPASATLTCERGTNTCAFDTKSLFGGEARTTIAVSDVLRARVEESRSSSSSSRTYRLVLETRNGTFPFSGASDSSRAGKDRMAEQINAFVRDDAAASLVVRHEERTALLPFSLLLIVIGGAIGLVGASVLTVTLDHLEGAVTHRSQALVRVRERSEPLESVTGVVLATMLSSGKTQQVVRVVNLRLASGEALPISDRNSGDVTAKRVMAEKVREFLGFPEVEQTSEVMTLKDITAFLREFRAGQGRAAAAGGTETRAAGGDAPVAATVTASAGLTPFTVGVPIRAVAIMLDFLAISALTYLLSRIGLGSTGSLMLWPVLSIGYYTVYEALTGATLGKQLLGLCVVRLDGSPIGWRESLVRNVARVVDAFAFYLVAAVSVLTSPHAQRLGDRLAGTTVVMRRSLPAIRPSAEQEMA